MKMTANRILTYFLLAAILLTTSTFAAYSYQQLTKEEISVLVPSSERFVESLAGGWDMSFDGENWEKADLPMTNFVNKKVIFKRFVKINNSLLKSLNWKLYFLGIDQEIEVHINDQFVGRYVGAMTPFEVKIPARMISGETNLIKLVVSPSEGASRKIKTQNPFAKRISTGVMREILLIGTNQVWVSDVDYSTKLMQSGSAQIAGSVSISSGKIETLKRSITFANDSVPSKEFTLEMKVSLINKATRELIHSEAPHRIKIDDERVKNEKFEFSVSNLQLWSLDNPHLYELQVELSKSGSIIDNYSVNIGIRDLRLSKTGDKLSLMLNGEAIDIKGVSYVEDLYGSGYTLSSAKLREDIENISTLGANLIRFRLGPPHPLLPYYCDKYGILFFAELPLYDVPSDLVALNEIQVLMQNIARRLVDTYGTHPSLAAWGISEGLYEGKKSNNEFHKETIKLFKSISDRSVYKIVPLHSNDVNDNNFDFIGIEFPVNGINLNSVNTTLSNTAKKIKKPYFCTFGKAISPKNHNGYSDPLSVEYQAYFILSIYKIAMDNNAMGSIINNYNDYPLESPLMIAGSENLYVATNGLVDRERNVRLSYNTLRSLFKSEKEPLLNAGSYSETAPVSFIIFGLALAIVLVFMINRFKRFREYFMRSLFKPYNFYADIRDQRIMSLAQTVLLGIIISVTAGIYIASILYFYKTSFEAQYVLMHILPSKTLQEFLFNIINMPIALILVFSTIAFVLAIITSLILRFLAFTMRARIFMSDSLTLAYWSGTPLIVLLPIAILLLRILVIQPATTVIFLALLFLIILWMLARLLKSISVVYDKRPRKVYVTGILIIAIVLAAVVGFYQLNYSIFAYSEYFFNVIIKG